MRSQYQHEGLVWIDLESPSQDDVRGIIETYHIAPLIAEELLVPSSKPRVVFESDYVYLVLHFPALRHSHSSTEQEIDFIIGKNFLITTHYETIDPLHNFSKVFEVHSVLEKSRFGEHAGFMFYYMLKSLYQAVENEVEYVLRELRHIEEDIFAGHEVHMVESISNSSRDLLTLRQRMEPHREVLRDFESVATQLFGSDFAPFVRSLTDDYYRVHNHIMRATESLHELRETNNSLLTTKQNETMRVLTLMALLTFPLALLVAVLDSNTISNPIVGHPYDFWIILALILALGGAMLWYFKYKRWM